MRAPLRHGRLFGGERLHEWVVSLEAWREAHGMQGGAVNENSAVVEEEIALGEMLLKSETHLTPGSKRQIRARLTSCRRALRARTPRRC